MDTEFDRNERSYRLQKCDFFAEMPINYDCNIIRSLKVLCLISNFLCFACVYIVEDTRWRQFVQRAPAVVTPS